MFVYIKTSFYISEVIEYVIYGTVIQEVKTSNIAREVSAWAPANNNILWSVI